MSYLLVEADTLAEARSEAQKKIPQDSMIIKEFVSDTGGPHTIVASGVTLEEARMESEKQLPASFTLIDKKETEPESKSLRISSNTKYLAVEAAWKLALAQKNTVVQKVDLAMPGKKGFLGIGKRKPQYDVLLLRKAIVTIKYKSKARIEVTIANPEELVEMKIKSLIEKLSLKPAPLDLYHPEQKKAMDEIELYGKSALKPLLQALDGSDENARSSIIYLLGCIQNTKEQITPIANQLKHNSSIIRNEAIYALGKFAAENSTDPEFLNYLKQAACDGNIQVREEAQKILGKLNTILPDVSWHTGTNTWSEITEAFIALEIKKPAPDFKGLDCQLQRFSAQERHGAWIDVAQNMQCIDLEKSMRCYIEALYNNPIPNSVAWSWLSGENNGKMNILAPNSLKTRQVIEELRRKMRPINED